MSQRFCQPKVAPVACSVAAGTRIRSNTFLRSRSSAARAREIRKKTPETSSAARSNDSMRPSTKPVRVSKIWTKKWMKISAQAKIHSRVLCDGECFRREMNIPTRTARIRMVGSLSKREVTIRPWNQANLATSRRNSQSTFGTTQLLYGQGGKGFRASEQDGFPAPLESLPAGQFHAQE